MDFFYHWIKTFIEGQAVGPGGILIIFGVSFLLGITHTFGPGHGKTMLLGVLVADSRRIGHALKMALVIGVTHIADVLVFSLVSIFIVASFPLESFSTIIRWFAGTGILIIGLWRVIQTLRTQSFPSSSDSEEDEPDHEHDHSHRESQNLLTAFLYSLAPCPAAWILFMACLGMGKPLYGFVLLLGFTLGLLFTIGGIAVSIVYSFRWLENVLPPWFTYSLQIASGLLIALLGGWLLVDGRTHSH